MELLHFKTIDSTNLYAKKLISEQEEKHNLHETVIYADTQTAGHGRMGRSFFSPDGTGIYMSLIYYPKEKLQNPALITASTAVAVCRLIDKTFNIETQIKWVNDIYYKGKKICGILTEGNIDFSSSSIKSVVIGIGINLNTQNFPEEIQTRAGSILCDCSNMDSFNKEQFISVLAEECFKLYESQTLIKKAFEEYRSRSLLIGKQVTVKPLIDNNIKDYPATVVDITDDAKLIVQTENGTKQTLDSGEVSLSI